MRHLIFDTAIDGHHLEYLHHLYIGVSKIKEDTIFIVPEKFNIVKNKFEWEKNEHISFDFLSEKEIEECNKKNYFLSTWNKCKVLKKYIERHNATNVILITLAHFLPILPFFLSSKIKISGIIYRIYLYEWKQLSLLKRIKDILEYLSITYSSNISSAYILNDNASTFYLNKLYRTNKFKFLPDPIVPLEYTPKNIRIELGMRENQQIFLHFGAMYRRKGTLLILNAIDNISKDKLKNMAFIFAGVIDNEIKTEFYEKFNRLKDKVQIRIFDEFCSYEKIYDLCISSDCIIIPYSNISFSSGVIGYSAQLNKPVIGPSKGLIGKIIRKHKLGISIDLNAESLAKAIQNVKNAKTDYNKYKISNSIDAFINSIIPLHK